MVWCSVFAGVGAGGEDQEASELSVLQLPWLAFSVAILFVGTFFHAPSVVKFFLENMVYASVCIVLHPSEIIDICEHETLGKFEIIFLDSAKEEW